MSKCSLNTDGDCFEGDYLLTMEASGCDGRVRENDKNAVAILSSSHCMT
jgi:hypothetical protein